MSGGPLGLPGVVQSPSWWARSVLSPSWWARTGKESPSVGQNWSEGPPYRPEEGQRPFCCSGRGPQSLFPEPEVGWRNFWRVDGNFHPLLVYPCSWETFLQLLSTLRAAGRHSVSFPCGLDTFGQLLSTFHVASSLLRQRNRCHCSFIIAVAASLLLRLLQHCRCTLNVAVAASMLPLQLQRWRGSAAAARPMHWRCKLVTSGE